MTFDCMVNLDRYQRVTTKPYSFSATRTKEHTIKAEQDV
jgi:hypothetical protein